MKNKENPNYYAILTADVRYSKEINFFEKVLYADITALTNKNGYCTASNGYFAELFDKTKETVSRAISKFEKLGFLKVIIRRDKHTKQVLDRKLYLLMKISIPLDENVKTPLDENVKTPLDENVKENTTSNNTTSNNTIKNKQKEKIPMSEINPSYLKLWNDLAAALNLNKVSKLTSKRKTKLDTRQSENNNFLEDFKTVIENIKLSGFLQGKNNRNWKVDFDWLIANDTNFIKVLEGKYTDIIPQAQKTDFSQFGSVPKSAYAIDEFIDTELLPQHTLGATNE